MWVESLFTISCSQQTGDLYSFVIWQKLARTRREFISDDLSSLWVEFNLKIILLYWSHYVRGFIELWEWEWRKIRRGVWIGVRREEGATELSVRPVCLLGRRLIGQKGWVVADILTRDQGYQNWISLASCSPKRRSSRAWTFLEVKQIFDKSPLQISGSVSVMLSDNVVFLGSGSPGRLLTLWMIWTVRIIPVTHYWHAGYELSWTVTDGTNGHWYRPSALFIFILTILCQLIFQ